VKATGEISFFKIISESSSAAGIRRIEAITGGAAEKLVEGLQDKLATIAEKLNSPEQRLFERIDVIIKQKTEMEKALNEAKQNAANDEVKILADKVMKKDGFEFIITQVNTSSTEDLRKLGDEMKAGNSKRVSVLFAVIDDKVTINVAVGKELLDRFHAGKLAGQIAEYVGGKGGGKPDSAMAGGKDVDKIDFAINETKKLFN